MKKLFLLAALALTCQIFSQSFATVNTKDYVGKTYGIYFALGTVVVKLNTDGTYEASYGSEGMYWHNSGKYEFRKDIIELMPDVCKSEKESSENISCDKTLGEATIELNFTDQDLYFTQFLKVTSKANHELLTTGQDNNSFQMGVIGKQVPAGETRYFNNEKVVIMGMKGGITSSEVKIRKTPDANGEVVLYSAELFGESMKAVPNKTYVNVIARTENKVKVQKWDNYWYLVNVGINEEVWMFGEFVKFE